MILCRRILTNTICQLLNDYSIKDITNSNITERHIADDNNRKTVVLMVIDSSSSNKTSLSLDNHRVVNRQLMTQKYSTYASLVDGCKDEKDHTRQYRIGRQSIICLKLELKKR